MASIVNSGRCSRRSARASVKVASDAALSQSSGAELSTSCSGVEEVIWPALISSVMLPDSSYGSRAARQFEGAIDRLCNSKIHGDARAFCTQKVEEAAAHHCRMGKHPSSHAHANIPFVIGPQLPDHG